MTENKPITVWQRWTPPSKAGPGFWSHNHIEDGHAAGDKPADPFNRGWSAATWRKSYAQLVGGKVCNGAQ